MGCLCFWVVAFEEEAETSVREGIERGFGELGVVKRRKEEGFVGLKVEERWWW